MTRHQKVLQRVLRGTSDANIGFEELCDLLRRMNFVERQHRGSHRIFTREGIVEILNLQARGGGQAKPYQVRQVRQLILKYTLAGEVPDGDSQ